MKQTVNDIKESGLLEVYVFGNPSEQQINRVNEYIDKYPELTEYINHLEKLSANLASENAINPPDAWKSEILAQATSNPQIPAHPSASKSKPKPKQGVSWPALLAGCLLGGILVGSVMYTTLSKTSQALHKSQTAYAQLKVECQQDKEIYASNQQIIEYLQDGQTQLIVLKANDREDQNHISVYWNDAQQKAIASIKYLDPLPPNQTYQLWADVEGEMISIALLSSKIQTFVDIKHLDNISSLNVTVEPLGGSEHPTISQLVLSSPV